MARLNFFSLRILSLLFIIFFLISTIYLALSTIQEQPSKCNCSEKRYPQTSLRNESDNPEWGPHRLAVIVPFRDRFEELLQFAPYIHKFLNEQKIRHKIFIVNQVDILRFNRASLINVGFLVSQKECDYIAMHDVDLLPDNKHLNYSYPESGPFHVASPDLHPMYHYPTFVGGILLLKNAHFKLVNGMSNKYWGWGREDDEFYVRMKDANLKISRPQGLSTGIKDTFKHVHERKRARDNKRYFNQKAKSRVRDKISGLDTIQYQMTQTTHILIDKAPVTILNVELVCDLDFTPYCVPPETFEIIQQYLLAKKRGEVGEQLVVKGESHLPTKKYKFKQPLDLHNFVFKDKIR